MALETEYRRTVTLSVPLTRGEVQAIRRTYRAGYSIQRTASSHHVTAHTVREIVADIVRPHGGPRKARPTGYQPSPAPSLDLALADLAAATARLTRAIEGV